MTRFRPTLPLLLIGVCIALVAVACVQPQPPRKMPPRPPIASSKVAPDVRATAVGSHTDTRTPTATTRLPIPPGSFVSPAPATAPPPVKSTPTPYHLPAYAPVPVNTPTLSSMVEEISPSVVQIITPTGIGSGFVIDSDGLIITNAHVVQGLSTVDVRFTGGRTYGGRVLGVDEVADIALLDLAVTRPLKPVTLGDSNEIMVGEDVVAMGFPLGDMLGVSPTITRGIVSAKRSISEVTLLQTDAAINPGSSGGPLFGRNGQVVGVNTAKLFLSDDGMPLEGIGLAVSINDVRDRLDSLVRGESVLLDSPSSLGTRELASALNDILPASFEEFDLEDEGMTSYDDTFTHSLGYISLDPFQMVLASTGELSDSERVELEQMLSDPDALLGDLGKSALLEGFSSSMGVESGEVGLLSMRQVGDWSLGFWIVDDSEFGRLRMDVVIFLQDFYVGLAAAIYSTTTDPSASVEDIASAIDLAILQHTD